MNIKKLIITIFSVLLIIFINSCDVLIKKNEVEFSDKNKDSFKGINFLHNSPDFMSIAQNEFVFTNDRKYLYTYNSGATSSIFVFDTQFPGSTFNMQEFALNSMHLAISPDDKFLYTSNGTSIIYVYKRNDNGTLTYINEIYDSLMNSIRFIAVSPNNSYLYILCSYSGSSYAIVWYKKDIENGKLGTVRFQSLSAMLEKFSFSPDSRFMYLSTTSAPYDFQWHEMNYKNGYMAFRGSLGLMVSDFSISGNGSYLYLTTGGSTVEAYERNKDNGNLKFIDTASVNAGLTISSLLVSPDNNYLFTTTGNAQYNIEWFPLKNSGTFSGHFVYSNGSILNYPLAIDFTCGGKFLYVLCLNSYNIAVFYIEGNN